MEILFRACRCIDTTVLDYPSHPRLLGFSEINTTTTTARITDVEVIALRTAGYSVSEPRAVGLIQYKCTMSVFVMQ